jgi:crenactin
MVTELKRATYKQEFTFGMDYGTGDFKYGPISCGEKPEIVENRGYFPDKESIMYTTFENPREIIVGRDVPLYLQASEDLSSRLVYPMKNGVIEKNDMQAWNVVQEISRYGVNTFKPADADFQGFYLVSSLSSVSPRYMYERIFDIYREINNEQRLVKAATVIQQPLAVAIAHKTTTCVVIESGHGNTQVCPISRYPIRNAIVAINRGGGDANALTAEILKDQGYGDLAREEAIVRKVKENIGLVPIDLDKAVASAKKNPKKFKAKFKIPGTRISIDLEENSWTRFLIGEYVFNPNHELFQSYFSRGMGRPKDVKIGDTTFKGTLDFGEAVVEAVERCPIELQQHLYRQVLLSGGNFSWNPPENLKDIATDSTNKMRILLRQKGVTNVKSVMTESPQFSVWRGCVIYGYAVPEDYEWNWERMEGWNMLGD